MAVFDSHPILRMSSYEALVTLRIPVDAPDGLLVHWLSENVCSNCCPKSDGPGGLSAIQTEYTPLRTVEVLHKLASEAVDEESKLAILATALCNSASVIRKTACTLIASTGNPTNSFWIRRLLKIITRDPDSGVKISAIQALRKCALQFADVKQMSSPRIILEHLHQSLRNAARDEWNSDVRFKLLQLLIDLIEIGVITRETNEDITDRDIEQLLYKPQVYLNKRVDKMDVQAAQYITQNERTDGSKLLTFKSRDNQSNRLSLSPISSRIIKSIAYESPRSMTSSNHRMNGPKKLVQFQLSRTYQLLKHFEYSDPCPGIRRMLSSRTDTLFTSLLNRENDKSSSDEVYFLADDRQLIRQMVFKLGRDTVQIYHDMTQINKTPSKGAFG
ncbi:hypothetical protein FGIG_10293 [Fasciola gigantica]|uniref:TOG domain-containing protein n=1 Tax=Fasciola gigantica TaxID=46835 RepID=A0A504Y615_FASGI|nr:hypothetical protein FGIG_10293 [Fasciola gigantica]